MKCQKNGCRGRLVLNEFDGKYYCTRCNYSFIKVIGGSRPLGMTYNIPDRGINKRGFIIVKLIDSQSMVSERILCKTGMSQKGRLKGCNKINKKY